MVGVVKFWKLVVHDARGWHESRHSSWADGTAAFEKAKKQTPHEAGLFACSGKYGYREILTWHVKNQENPIS